VQISKDLNQGLGRGGPAFKKGIEGGKMDGPPAPTHGTSLRPVSPQFQTTRSV
jgi:hypothetical protein